MTYYDALLYRGLIHGETIWSRVSFPSCVSSSFSFDPPSGARLSWPSAPADRLQDGGAASISSKASKSLRLASLLSASTALCKFGTGLPFSHIQPLSFGNGSLVRRSNRTAD